MSAVVTTSTTVDLDLPAEPAAVPAARRAVCGLIGRGSAVRGDVALAVSEAVTNVVLHAYRHQEDRPGRVQVQAALDEDCLDVVVRDDGIGLSPRPDSPGLGLGLPTISALADVSADSGAYGTTLRLRFSLA